jgi:hypothetical protein
MLANIYLESPMQISILCPAIDVHLNWRASFARLSEALAMANIETVAVPWTRLGGPGDEHAAAFLAWGYHLQPGRWLGLLRQRMNSARLLNPARSLIWNSDKLYLRQLAALVPVVPTRFVHKLTCDAAVVLHKQLRSEILVAKPRWGASGYGLTLIRRGKPVPALRDVLLQPMLRRVETEGEISLLFFGGKFSHSIRKLPARGDFRVQSDFGGSIEPFAASENLVEMARRAIAGAPDELAYARVDIVRSDEDGWQLMELEAIEPELFLDFAPDAGLALALACRSRLFDHLKVAR